MRKLINLIESITKKNFVGTCVNSFDEDGNCIVGDLPWSHVSDLGYADENALEISSESFLQQTVRSEAEYATIGHDVHYLASEDGVLMLYDDTEDVHYFYV